MKLELINHKIRMIRGHSIILDYDLAKLYGVETRVLKQAVKRNINRFPNDFMIILDDHEMNDLVSQSVIPSKSKLGGAPPFAFTEQGVAMLSSVLNSDKAIEVNIAIMRAFVLLRQHFTDYKNLKSEIEVLEKEMNKKFKDIYQVLDFLLKKEKQQQLDTKREPIGFKTRKDR